ncbi:prolipoprotein diacylglyceryl transferase [Patescibacteria group bacterium]|nr:prolipoprotein diacylglyceryl transferase [Patescibacteria group bacterium]
MQFLILVLLACFVVFLFSVYKLTREDFVLLRKDVPVEQIFNIAFLTGFFALLSARLFYVLIFPKKIFMSFLGFILFPYFPGLSLVGGVLGGIIFLYLLCISKKLPLGRIFDFYTIGLLSAMPFGYLGYMLLAGYSFASLASLIIFTVFLIMVIKFILPQTLIGEFKEGSLFMAFLLVYSLATFLISIFFNGNPLSFDKEHVMIGLFFVFSLALFLYQKISLKRSIKK